MRVFYFSPVVCLIIVGFFSCGKTPVHKDFSTVFEESSPPKKTTIPEKTTISKSKAKAPVTVNKTGSPEFNAAVGEARIVIVKPAATLGELKNKVYANGKYQTIKIGNTMASLPLESGEHLIISENPGDTGVTVDLKSGRLYYLTDNGDAASLVELGDILYEKKNNAGALALYRQALKVDPASTGFYKRYAELVIGAKGSDDEIIKALDGVVASNQADMTTYSALGKIYLNKSVRKKAASEQKRANRTKAVSMYEKVLGLDPQNREALQAIAECKIALGDAKGAAGAYEKVVNADTAALEQYRTLGDLYFKQQQKSKAMSAYRKYLEKGGKNQAVTKKLGTHYYTTKQYKDAALYLSKVRGKMGKQFTHQLMLAESYYNAGQYRKAIASFKALNARNPKVHIKMSIYRKLAESYIHLNENQKALFWVKKYSKLSKGKNREVSYLKAFLQEKRSPATARKLYLANTKSFPRDHRNFLNLGLMYSKKRATLSKSVPLLKKAVALADTIPAVWLELAEVYGKLRKANDELYAYKKYIQTDPENLEANIRVGTILLERGKVKEGMGYLEKANTKSPDNVKVMVALSQGYVHTKRTQEAIDLLTRAKKLKADDLSIRKQLFDIYTAKGEEQKALDEIKQLLEVKRDSESLLLYAQLLMKSDDIAGAENSIEDIRATDPENIEAIMILATIYQKQKKYTNAIDLYKEIIIIEPKYVPALRGQGDVYVLLSKVLWAEKFYKRALQADPDCALAELGFAKIALIRKNNTQYKKHLDRAYFFDPKDPVIKAEYKKRK